MVTEQPYRPPSIRAIVAGVIIFTALLIVLCSLSEVVKLVGSPFLYIPARLGLIQRVTRDQVRALDLASGSTVLDFTPAGRYAVFTIDYDLLVLTDGLLSAHAAPWLRLKSQETGKSVAVSFIERGLRPYDTPFARGRPIFTFYIEAPGRYVMTYPARNATIFIVPDYTTGKEKTIALAYFLQIAVIGAFLGGLFYPRLRRYWIYQREIAAERRQKRIAADAFWQTEVRRKREK